MNFQKLTNLFNSLLSQANKKSERNIYSSFIRIFSSLEQKDLSEQQFQSIQEQLSSMNLESTIENKKKFYKKKLAEFLNFLKEQFSFTSKTHHTELGISLGLALGSGFGLTLGVAIDPAMGTSIGLAMGTGIGMVIGMMYGAKKDAEAKSQGLVI